MKKPSDNEIYFFIGNITSHILHALPLWREIGGTFVVTSKQAEKKLEQYAVPVVRLDNIPYVWKWGGKRPVRIHEYISLGSRFKKTYDFLNTNAKVVIFYELFDIKQPKWITAPKKVFLTHGNMLKNYFKMHPARLEVVKDYDYMAALGPFMRREFVDSGIDSEKLIDIGIARTDEVAHTAGKVSISDTLKRLGVKPDKPIIGYLPTFWGDSSVENLGPEMLERISDDYTVLFRPHPQTPRQIIDKYSTALSRENIFYIPEKGNEYPSLLDVYAASSAIVGDLSSVMLEALLLDKPLIFADTDSHSEIPQHNQLTDVQKYCATLSINNVGNIDEIIEASLHKQIDTKLWKQAKDTSFFDHDGTSTENIAKFIRSIR